MTKRTDVERRIVRYSFIPKNVKRLDFKLMV